MANFKTHLSVATGASAILSITTHLNGLIALFDIPWFIFLGSIGGLLPDIDSSNSHPLRLLFTSLSTLTAVLTILAYKDQYMLQHIFIFAGIAFIIVRYPILALFKKLTVHRGIFHSLFAVTFFTLLTVYINYVFFQTSIKFAWISGIFIGFGFIVHLLLDEVYSVDLSNARLKKSFGTAFKIMSLKYPLASLMMFMACATLYHYTPEFPFPLL